MRYNLLMEIKKSIQLTTEPLSHLIEAGESIDFRLDQAVWKDLQTGDLIEFWEDLSGWQTEPADDARKVLVQIKKIYKAPNFLELFEIIESDTEILGSKHSLLEGLRGWWSEKKEVEEGVLAFYVVVIKS